MRTNAVVDVITQYLMTFGPLLGDIKKERVLTTLIKISCQPIQLLQIHFLPFQSEHFFFLHFHFFLPFSFIYKYVGGI